VRLIEAEGKAMLERRGIATPVDARVYRQGDVIGAADHPVAIKAQVLSGKRAESGLVVLSPGSEAPLAAARVLQRMSERGDTPIVLMESQVQIKSEFYLAWRIDDLRRCYVMMFSVSGGADIEERAESVRQYFHSPLVEPQPYHLAPLLREAGLNTADLGSVARFAVSLFAAFREEEAVLLEINPLVITQSRGVVAVDAKVVLDENAEKRHVDRSALVSAGLQAGERTELEAVAAKEGFTFVELEGSVAVYSAGAGLGMCILDMLADAEMPAANFSDASGGSDPAVFAKLGSLVFRLAERSHVKSILFFFVLSATSLKSIVDGIIGLLDAGPPPKPLVVGLIAAGAAERELTLAEAQLQIGKRGIRCVTDLSEAVHALAELT
jgi:succinyl-CoA synthetase beta subunit